MVIRVIRSRLFLLVFVAPLGWTATADAHRQYDPAKRRFAQRDPILVFRSVATPSIDGGGLYTYVRAHPLLGNDPSGLFTGKEVVRCYKANPSAEGAVDACRWAELNGLVRPGSRNCVTFCCDSMDVGNNGYFEPPCRPQTCCGLPSSYYGSCPDKCIMKHESARAGCIGCGQSSSSPGMCTNCRSLGALGDASPQQQADCDCKAYSANSECQTGECNGQVSACRQRYVDCIKKYTCVYHIPVGDYGDNHGLPGAITQCNAEGAVGGCP
jgi:hypothetical protein